jgi:hypothetical protein
MGFAQGARSLLRTPSMQGPAFSPTPASLTCIRASWPARARPGRGKRSPARPGRAGTGSRALARGTSSLRSAVPPARTVGGPGAGTADDRPADAGAESSARGPRRERPPARQVAPAPAGAARSARALQPLVPQGPGARARVKAKPAVAARAWTRALSSPFHPTAQGVGPEWPGGSPPLRPANARPGETP